MRTRCLATLAPLRLHSIYSGRRGVPVSRGRGADRRGQDATCRTPGPPHRRYGRARGVRQSVSRRLLQRAAWIAALQAQLFYLLSRHRQLTGLRQADLFQHSTVCDYLFDRDKIFAYLNLDDNELFIYQRLYDLLVKDVPSPDLVVYLQAPTDVLLRRLRDKPADPERQLPEPDANYVRELNEAYQHYFFHYTATPLLVVETSEFEPEHSDEALDDLAASNQQPGEEERGTTSRGRDVEELRSCSVHLLSSVHGMVQEGAQANRVA